MNKVLPKHSDQKMKKINVKTKQFFKERNPGSFTMNTLSLPEALDKKFPFSNSIYESLYVECNSRFSISEPNFLAENKLNFYGVFL